MLRLRGFCVYIIRLPLLLRYEVAKTFVISDTFKLVLDDLLDLRLDVVVVRLDGLFHAVVAVGILELIDYRDGLVGFLLTCNFSGVNDNLTMKLNYAVSCSAAHFA